MLAQVTIMTSKFKHIEYLCNHVTWGRNWQDYPGFLITMALEEEEEWSCQLDRQLMKHHRGDTPSWGCAPPLIHVPEGMRSCICVEARDLLLCTLSCWPVGSVLLSVIHPHCHKSLSLAVKPLFSQRDLASNRSLWYLRWALVPARTRARYMRPASPGGA